MIDIADAQAQFVTYDEDGTEYIGDYAVHRLSSMFPWLPEDEFAELCDSIEKHGQQQPILLQGDEVVSGRNRLLACLTLGIEPIIEVAEDIVDVAMHVEVENIHRRSLSKSQRAMLLMALRQKQDVATTMKEMAESSGLSYRLLKHCSRVLRNGTEALIASVLDGHVTVTDASEISRLPLEEQEAAIEAHLRGDNVSSGSGDTGGAETREKPQWTFERWEAAMEKKISRMLAECPEDQRERCTRAIAELLSVPVRYSPEDGGACLPMEGEALAEAVLEQLDEMPQEEREIADEVLRKRYGGGKKPKEYLPPLPDDHLKATDVVKAEVKARTDQLLQFEDWEFNGRREGGRRLKQAVQRQMSRLTKHAGLDIAGEAQVADEPIPSHLDTEEFRDLWREWNADRRRKKRSVGQTTQRRQLGILGRFATDQAIEILSRALEKDWKGIPTYDSLSRDMWCGRPAEGPDACAAAHATNDDAWQDFLNK